MTTHYNFFADADGNQRSKFKCVENASAIDHLEKALAELRERTRQRESLGIEGTHTP